MSPHAQLPRHVLNLQSRSAPAILRMSSLSLPLPSPPVLPLPLAPALSSPSPSISFYHRSISSCRLTPSAARTSPAPTRRCARPCPRAPQNRQNRASPSPPAFLSSCLTLLSCLLSLSPSLTLPFPLAPSLPLHLPCPLPSTLLFLLRPRARARAPAPLAGQPPLAVVSSGRGARNAPGSSSSNHVGNDGDRHRASASASARVLLRAGKRTNTPSFSFLLLHHLAFPAPPFLSLFSLPSSLLFLLRSFSVSPSLALPLYRFSFPSAVRQQRLRRARLPLDGVPRAHSLLRTE